MKRLLLIIAILALVLVPIGCADIGSMIEEQITEALEGLSSTYTIKIGGTAGLNFSGRYVVASAAYDPETWVAFSTDSYDVTGNVSEQYTVEDVISVGGMFQKQAVDGTLEVEIWKGSTKVDSAVTTDPWGAVLVTVIGKE
jgi:hypothetical protein